MIWWTFPWIQDPMVHGIWVHNRLPPRLLSNIVTNPYTVGLVPYLVLGRLVVNLVLASGHLVMSNWAYGRDVLTLSYNGDLQDERHGLGTSFSIHV
ncbi:hypothetical protein M3J09_008346 [Ascochyta lentis]